MPFKSKKQELYFKINLPQLYRKWVRKYGHYPTFHVSTNKNYKRKRMR